MSNTDRILQLRAELHQHNYNYYVLNQPTISDRDFPKDFQPFLYKISKITHCL